MLATIRRGHGTHITSRRTAVTPFPSCHAYSGRASEHRLHTSKPSSATTNATITKSSFRQTLHFITDVKLQELEKQRVLYKTHASSVVNRADACGASLGDILKKVEILVKSVKSWTGSGAPTSLKTVGEGLNLRDLEFWLQQAKNDSSFSKDIAQGWADTLEQHIRHVETRFDAAKLFGDLFNEWLASDVALATSSDAAETNTSTSDVGRKEMHEQKEKLESIIFEEFVVDVSELTEYLNNIFASEEASNALKALRKDLKTFGLELQRKTITSLDVAYAIKGLLTTGLMDEEKRTTLKAFEKNPTILDEVASVLTMRIGNLDTWKWPTEGTVVEFRRHLNGKYRASTDPDIIDALLLHHIGVAWQIKLKTLLYQLFDSKAWIRPMPPTVEVKEHLSYQLSDYGCKSIETERETTRRKHFFMTQLHHNTSVSTLYEGQAGTSNLDGTTVKYKTRKRQRLSSGEISPAFVKQKLLQIMTTECYLNTTLHGGYASVCSDLEWFGPSLPHASILTVLDFFGMPKGWLAFYKNFLSMPVRFPGDTEPRMRKRGTPIDYSLSVVCGEVIMFIMDFAVNQRAKGLYLYRMHDDLWLWDSNVEKVASGWAEMQRYTALVGLKFNEQKSGSAYIGLENKASITLPANSIRWGFLKFDTGQKRFCLDQDDINKHIVEMRHQLSSTKSVFGWVNTYNKYMAFFFRNFGGTPTKCFSKEHISEMIGTFAYIQNELFPPSLEIGAGGAVGHLRRILEERFGITDLPEGYFYFPIASGGLRLRNTMLELFALEKWGRPFSVSEKNSDGTDAKIDENENLFGSEIRDCDGNSVFKMTSTEVFQESKIIADQKFIKRVEYDAKAYAQAIEKWQQDEERRWSLHNNLGGVRDKPFMSFVEYTSLRESWLEEWGNSYRDMLTPLNHVEVAPLPRIRDALEETGKSWNKMNWYEKWVMSMYGEGVIRKYGGIKAVDPALIPVGMVELFRTSRIKLDQ